MKRKILSILFALVLAASLSLVPATALSQEAGHNYANYVFGASTGNGAEWSTAKLNDGSGAYSAMLDHNGGATKRAYIKFTPPTGISLTEFAAAPGDYGFSYLRAEDKIGPQLELTFTDGGDGSVEMTAEVALYDYTTDDDIDVWIDKVLTADEQCHWYASNPDGETFDYGGVIVDLDELIADIDGADEMEGFTTCGDWEMTQVLIDLGWSGDTQTAYIDDVIIADTVYDLEPLVLDAEWYKTGDTVGVSVYNGYATGSIAAFAYSDSVGEDHPITISLSETSADVFTGGFELVDATPGAGELLVNEEDTIYVKCMANWGVGSQELAYGPEAVVDDTAPEITIVSPEDEAITTDNTTDIEADYADADSGIDTTTTVMTLDGDAVIPTTNTTTETTYTTVELDDGDHTITVDVSDIAGNEAEQASWTFTVDTIAPVIEDAEADPAVIPPDEETEVIFTVTVTDATSGVATVTIDLSDVGGDEDVEMLDDGEGDDEEEDDGIYTATVDITEEDEDDYDLTITATDEAGNADEDDVTLGVWSDTTEPVITDPEITYPFDLTSARPGDDVTISANVTDETAMGTVTAACDAFEADVDLLDDGEDPDEEADDDIYTGTATIDADAAKGDYTLTITAEDAVANTATDDTLEVSVVSGATGAEIVLDDGWNLISLPLIPDDSDITAVINADSLGSENISNVGIIRAYDPDTGEFPYYVPDSETGDLDVMEDGAGYWIYLEEEDTLTVTGREWPLPPEVPPTYDVVVGWNLIGFKSLEDDAAADYLDNIDGTYPVVWSYDADAGAYENVKDANMVVGHGFWIWITEAGTIVPPQ